MPMRTVQSVGPIEMVVQIENMAVNVEDPPDLTMPESIQALLPSSEPAPADDDDAPSAPNEPTE